MIPIKNKKKTLDVTVEEMRRFSFSYRFDDPTKWQEAVDCLKT